MYGKSNEMAEGRGNQMMRKFLVICALILLVYPVAAQYPVLTGYVTDTANILSPDEEAMLTAMISTIEQNTTVEMAVLTVPNTGGEDKVLYAAHTGDQNGVGKSATDNGIVIMWSLDNVKGGAIATGRGIESTVTDARTSGIGRNARPYFDGGNYYGGFAYIISNLDLTLEPGLYNYTAPAVNHGLPAILIIGVPTIGIIFIVWVIFITRLGRGHVLAHDGPSSSRSSHNYPSTDSHTDTDDDGSAALAAAVFASTMASRRRRSRDTDDDSSSYSSSHDDDDDGYSGGGSSGSGGFDGFGGGGFGGGGSGF